MNGLGAARGIGLRGNLGRWTVESEIWVLSLLFISKIFCLFPLFPPVLASPRLKYLSNSRHSQFTLIPSTDGYTDHVNSRVASYIIPDVWAQDCVGPCGSGRVAGDSWALPGSTCDACGGHMGDGGRADTALRSDWPAIRSRSGTRLLATSATYHMAHLSVSRNIIPLCLW